ncbi:butyrate kinase [Clostridium sp. WLY-B-L2]|uniref:Probable butyrate kinase n=1 Tax=Clostridium aromativorans TaxID=2836848 RepID=A0ABS8N800_9CLOT|nr:MULTISPECIES: butyrate kinase [Clostridium]KAA8680581.1 butyrate kinase [Clostridium sp. HV4-5-A1G]MCC9295304.1 butyrate kinase [Clostridium aromativorans]CAB1261730.1 Butyrate kinase [Clostridiaceae bacterium BL-3]
MEYRILVIDPGSTSTKVYVCEGKKEILKETIMYSSSYINKYDRVYDQFQFRKEDVLKILRKRSFDLNTLSAVVGRGGLLNLREDKIYRINEAMIEDLKVGIQGEHASNLGAIIADSIAGPLKIPAFTINSVTVDELWDIARISGMPDITRKSKFHALNQKAVAKKYAADIGMDYADLNLIVAHMGGGVSVGAHKRGRVVDVNNALDGDGPFTPERAGGIPVGDLVNLCYSCKYSYHKMKRIIAGEGGMVAYLGTNDFRKLEMMVNMGDKKARIILDAFILQVSKEIGKCAAVLSGDVNAIILTGGIAYSENVVNKLKERVSFISSVICIPERYELLELAQVGFRALNGEEIKEYKIIS